MPKSSPVAASARNIGLEVSKAPEGPCTDAKCPYHGKLGVRGITIECKVVSDKMMNTIVAKREYLRYSAKFERYEKRANRYMAHNPPCIAAKVGDSVTIAECRPLSKTVSFVVIEKR